VLDAICILGDCSGTGEGSMLYDTEELSGKKKNISPDKNICTTEYE
jgi:hypothetical protein